MFKWNVQSQALASFILSTMFFGAVTAVFLIKQKDRKALAIWLDAIIAANAHTTHRHEEKG